MTPQEVEQILDMLVEKLGPIGTHVWSIYVRQVYIEAWAQGIFGILCLLAVIGSTIGLIWCCKQYKKVKESDRSYGAGERQLIGIIISVIIAGVAGFCVPFLLYGFTLLFNPEYHAIQMLLGR